MLLLLFTGRIVVKYVYDEMVHQRDYWRDKYTEGEEVRRELVAQNGTLVEAVASHARNDEMTVALLRSIRAQIRTSAGGDPNAMDDSRTTGEA